MGFYEELQKADKAKPFLSLTAIGGSYQGAKALWSGGRFLYREREGNALWDSLQEDMGKFSKNRIVQTEHGPVFCELVTEDNHLVICGAGHISLPVIQMGKMLGFHVTVIDDRLSFTEQAVKAGADFCLCKPFALALEELSGSCGHYFVIVTRGHRYDQDCLFHIIRKEHAYIGMIGSRSRVGIVKEQLLEQGADRESLEQIHAPIGLAINAQTPEEIAVAIMAEIIQIKNQSKSGFGYPRDILDQITGKECSAIPKALVTIVSRKGSAPRAAGTKMLVFADGKTVGTIGGGCVEAEVCTLARAVAKSRVPALKKVDMTPGDAGDEGMACGGVVEVYVEPV